MTNVSIPKKARDERGEKKESGKTEAPKRRDKEKQAKEKESEEEQRGADNETEKGTASLTKPSTEASILAPLPVSEPMDPLNVSLPKLLASIPSSNKEEDFSVVMSADSQEKLNECLKLYSSCLLSLARNAKLFDQFGLLFDLADHSDLFSIGKYFAKTLSSQLSSFLTRQQTLSVEFLFLDHHFNRINHFKTRIPEIQ